MRIVAKAKTERERSDCDNRRESPIKARIIKIHTSLRSKQFCDTIMDNNTNISKSVRLHNNRNKTRHIKEIGSLSTMCPRLQNKRNDASEEEVSKVSVLQDDEQVIRCNS